MRNRFLYSQRRYYAMFTFGRWDMYVPAGKYNPVSEYVYGNNLVSRSDYDEKYAWSGRFTGTEYYTTDILGSVMLTTDSLGRVLNRYNYDAYGTNYTGTGWYNYGYRDYDSKLGRFTTQDPIRDGMNWYAYCGGDPINLIDLWGLEYRDRYGTWRSNSDKTYKLEAAMNNHKNDKYISPKQVEPGQPTYQCDDYVQTVLKESEIYQDKLFAGDSQEKTVAQHIKNAEENGIKQNKKDNAPDLTDYFTLLAPSIHG